MSAPNVAALTILVLTLEERITDAAARHQASMVVNMVIAAGILRTTPPEEKRSAFTVAFAVLEALIDGKPLSAEFAGCVRHATAGWLLGPQVMRDHVEGVRRAYVKRKQQEAP